MTAISKLTLRDQAILFIKEKIHGEYLISNKYIRESDICSELGMSRTPVREALISLEHEGLIEKVPNKGYLVKHQKAEFKLNIFSIIGALDALAAKLAVPFITQKDFLKMNELIDMIDIAIAHEDFTLYYKLQEDFHNVYIEKCSNFELIQLLSKYKDKVSYYTYYTEDIDNLFEVFREVNQQHRIILQYFQEGDKDKLSDFIQNEHWSTKYLDMI